MAIPGPNDPGWAKPALTEQEKYIAGNFAGALAAIDLLVRRLDRAGALKRSEYVESIKTAFNAPNAKHDRHDYEFLRRLAARLEQ